MQTLVDCPESRAGEWSFRIFDIPVRVKFWFWVAILIVAGDRQLIPMSIWVAVCFVSILVHELGHVVAFRFFRERAEVLLYGWGGLAIPDRAVRGSLPGLVVALAGPVAGFCLAALSLVAARASHFAIQVQFHAFLPAIFAVPRAGANLYWGVLLNDLLWVNFYWGLVNLLPVYPLDGGCAAQAIFEQADPFGGRRKALLLSVAVAGVVVVFSVVESYSYMLLMFAILGVSSLQLLDGLGGRAQSKPYRSLR
jgi:hypothetical protein